LCFDGIDHQTTEPLAPEHYDARRMVAAYYAQIELIDDQVGRMIEALQASGQKEHTVIIFMSDHGEMLGDHGLLLKGCRFYEGAVHVPLIISSPGLFARGLRSNALVELTDIVPTLLDVTGLPKLAELQGRSLLPILTGSADAHSHRSFVRSEYHDALDRPNASHANMILDGRHKLTVYHGHEMGELYDLEADPNEFRNLWTDPCQLPLRHDLMKRLFDAVMLATDAGQSRVGRY
jgi:arylsulfatase